MEVSLLAGVPNSDTRVSSPIKAEDQDELLFEIEENKEPAEKDIEQIDTQIEEQNEEEPVTFKEGLKLFGEGFVNKIKSMGKTIVEHPFLALGAVAAMGAALMALPLIGISTATGAAIMALGFAGYSLGKTTVDVIETVKDNKEGRYDEVREDLGTLGGDGVDLALSLPFVPKALKQVGRFAKYGTSTVGLNSELISNLKNVSSAKDIVLEFAKANTKINYEMIANEMGLMTKPELVFADLGKPSLKGDVFAVGEYEPATGTLKVNENALTGLGKFTAGIQGSDVESILRHELEHYNQFSQIAQTLGVDGLKEAIGEYYVKALRAEGIELPTDAAIDEASKEGWRIFREILNDNNPLPSYDEYHNALEAANRYTPGTNEYSEAMRLAQEAGDRWLSELSEYGKRTEALNIQMRNANSLERSLMEHRQYFEQNIARAAERTGLSEATVKNILLGDGSTFNSQLYQEIINTQGTIQEGTQLAQESGELLEAFIAKTNSNITQEEIINICNKLGYDSEKFIELAQKYSGLAPSVTTSIQEEIEKTMYFGRWLPKVQMEFYKQNLLEAQAYVAQDAYHAANVAGRSLEILDDTVMTLSALDDIEFFDSELVEIISTNLAPKGVKNITKEDVLKFGLTGVLYKLVSEGEITSQESSLVEQLEEYYKMAQEGIITKEEYEIYKEEILEMLEEEFDKAA